MFSKISIMVNFWLILLGVLAVGINSQGNETLQTAHNISSTAGTSNTTTNDTIKHTMRRQVMLESLPVTGHVAFSVRKAMDKLQAAAHIHFQDVLTNTGGGWDVATSEFVAPISGGYFFIFHAVGDRTNDFTMTLTMNGVPKVSAYGTMTTFEHGSNSVFLELRALDKVSLQLQQGSIYEHPGKETYTTFTGFLLYRL